MSKAEEFRKSKEFKYDHFTELTRTGINPNYKHIEEFAQSFADEQVKKALEGSNKAIEVACRVAELKALSEVEKSLPSDDDFQLHHVIAREQMKFQRNKTQEAINKLRQ